MEQKITHMKCFGTEFPDTKMFLEDIMTFIERYGDRDASIRYKFTCSCVGNDPEMSLDCCPRDLKGAVECWVNQVFSNLSGQELRKVNSLTLMCRREIMLGTVMCSITLNDDDCPPTFWYHENNTDSCSGILEVTHCAEMMKMNPPPTFSVTFESKTRYKTIAVETLKYGVLRIPANCIHTIPILTAKKYRLCYLPDPKTGLVDEHAIDVSVEEGERLSKIEVDFIYHPEKYKL